MMERSSEQRPAMQLYSHLSPSQGGGNAMDNLIRIVLAEDQSIIRQGLRYIIDAQPDMTVVGEAADGDQALQTTIQTAPDLVLMDIRMPKRNGIEATRAILEVL